MSWRAGGRLVAAGLDRLTWGADTHARALLLWAAGGHARGHATASQQLPNLTLYGRSFNVPTVRLQPGLRPDALFASLAARREVAPLFFKRTPVVIDVEEVPDELDQAALAEFVAMFRRLELVPIGIANANAAQKVGVTMQGGGRDVTGWCVHLARSLVALHTPALSRPRSPPGLPLGAPSAGVGGRHDAAGHDPKQPARKHVDVGAGSSRCGGYGRCSGCSGGARAAVVGTAVASSGRTLGARADGPPAV